MVSLLHLATNNCFKTNNFVVADNPFWFNSSNGVNANDDQLKWWNSYAECPLLNIETPTNRVRLVFELIQLIGAFLYIVAALREMRFLGYNMFIENLVITLEKKSKNGSENPE